MSTAEKILAPKLKEISFPMVDRAKKFYRHSELPGKLVRESDSVPIRPLRNEVHAMKRLVGEFEDRYGITTVNPQYMIGPGDRQGEGRAVIACDEIAQGETAEALILSGKYSASLDALNEKFIQHAKDLSEEGGLYNTELMYLGQYVMADNDTPVLVDVEPHYTRIIAPPEARIYGDVEKTPLIEMAEAIVQNAIMLSTNAGQRTPSSLEAEKFLEELELSEPPIRRARDAILEALRESSIDKLSDFIDGEEDIEWQKMQHARTSRTYVADL